MGYKLQLTDNHLCLNLIHTVFICSHFSSITAIGIRLKYAYFITIFKTKPYTVFRMSIIATVRLNICSRISCIILSKGYVIIILYCSVCKNLINIKSSFDEIYNLPSETTCNLILLTVALFAIVNRA